MDISRANDNFNTIIGSPGKSTTNGIIAGLAGHRGTINIDRAISRYTDLASRLPVLNCTFDITDTVGTIIGEGAEQIRYIGGGTYGTIFRGQTTGVVYKRTIMEPDDPDNILADEIEEFHRELYLEAYIQTVLQNDTTYHNNVARIDTIYRSHTVQTISPDRIVKTKAAEKTKVPPRTNTYTYFYKMEAIPNDLDAYLTRHTPSECIKMITTLGTILEYFYIQYGFNHRDLHTGNVMFMGDGTIKVIDFGKSCLNINGTVYAIYGTTCKSYDMFIFIMGLLENHVIPRELREKLMGFLNSNDGTSLYDELVMIPLPSGAAFHKAYYNTISNRAVYPWSNPRLYDTYINEVVEARLRPDTFLDAWSPEYVSYCDPRTWSCFRRKSMTRRVPGGKRKLRKNTKRTLRKKT